jgi:hypothetical protein
MAPGVDSASNRNEYQARLTTSTPSMNRLSGQMWEPRRPTTLWASTACDRDSFTFFFLPLIYIFLWINSRTNRSINRSAVNNQSHYKFIYWLLDSWRDCYICWLCCLNCRACISLSVIRRCHLWLIGNDLEGTSCGLCKGTHNPCIHLMTLRKPGYG